VTDDQVEGVLGKGQPFGVGHAALDLETERTGIALNDGNHARAQVGDVALLDNARQLQVQGEEPGSAAELERLRIRPARPSGDVGEPVARVVDTALVEGDRPLFVVGAGLPVVVEDVRQLRVVPRGGDLLLRRTRLGGSRHRSAPVKTAFPGPLAMNDAMPIRRSSVANSDANRCDSSRKPLLRSPSSPPSMAAFAAARASAGPFANFAAMLSAAE